MSTATQPDSERPYHHGDLRNALTDAAADLAASEGPEQITVRSAAKRVGVTPTAAYRHFAGRDDLVDAVKDRATAALSESMRAALRAISDADDPGAEAVARLVATGRGYCMFALTEPGLFRTVFAHVCPVLAPGDHEDESTESLLDNKPYRMFLAAVDGLVQAGLVPEEDRRLVEAMAWSVVHGMSMLLVDGPLRMLPLPQKTELINETLRYTATRWENGG